MRKNSLILIALGAMALPAPADAQLTINANTWCRRRITSFPK